MSNSSPSDFAEEVSRASTLAELDRGVTACRRCSRLIEWCERVAVEKRAAYRDEEYWGGPVPGFGSEQPKVWIVGLAPGAHGANRTGRMFTGDRSGDWLFASLHRAGLASLPTSARLDDGQRLPLTRITAAVHCAPPDNKPTTDERAACRHWLRREAELVVPNVRSVVALGSLAWTAALDALSHAGCDVPSPRPKFGHAVTFEVSKPHAIRVVGSYHPSQQNTFTGKLTEEMLDAIFMGLPE